MFKKDMKRTIFSLLLEVITAILVFVKTKIKNLK